MAGRTYELFGVKSHCIYYGTYSCVKVVTMNWGALSSLGREVSKQLGCSLKVLPLTKQQVRGRLPGDHRDLGWPCGTCRPIAHEEHV